LKASFFKKGATREKTNLLTNLGSKKGNSEATGL